MVDDPPVPPTSKTLGATLHTDAAKRALAEAEARRAALNAREAQLKKTPEIAGRGGLDPVRYDDWEIKGIAADF